MFLPTYIPTNPVLLPDCNGYGEPFVDLSFMLRGASPHEYVARTKPLGRAGRQARAAACAAVGGVSAK